MMPSPLISPARTTRLVVVIVSHATRASGSFDRNRSTIASEIWSATLSGWPSDTDSEVKRELERMENPFRGGEGPGRCHPHKKLSLYRDLAAGEPDGNREQQQRGGGDRGEPVA